MKKQFLILVFLMGLLLLGAVFIAQAQEGACELDATQVITIVEQTCENIGRDEICYGNYNVNIVAQDSAPDFSFTTPGDLTSLNFVRSLFLSAFDPGTEVWGIAQMRLLASINNGTQDVTLLLFGDVTIESAIALTTIMEVQVERYGVNIRNTPSSNAVILDSAASETILEAVGRLEDTSWLRVRVPDSDAVGWVLAELLMPVNEDETFDILSVQDAVTPYYGTMQAFYYTSGSSPSCENMIADGLIIQTPAGNARVNLLINEVSIELIGSSNGATAFITANAGDGMIVSMIDGTGVVEANGTSYYVISGTATTILMSNDMRPIGTPSVPTTFDTEEMASVALLPIVRDPTLPIVFAGFNVPEVRLAPDIPTETLFYVLDIYSPEGSGESGGVGSRGSGGEGSGEGGDGDEGD
ncbi:MAG: SH3 domain-containing protein [Anaerolineae bacterium]|nr:SH3 domain-containing protein [Anaerolineae bacterium]MDQ7037533.1 SH3 domain-containing protein [Anaerolineae bacterium]